MLGWSPSLSCCSLWWKVLEEGCCEQGLEREGTSVSTGAPGGPVETWHLPWAWVLAASPEPWQDVSRTPRVRRHAEPSQGGVMERS